MTNNSGDVWIRNHQFRFKFNLSNAEEVEKELKSYFNSGYPVILSSGRSAISLALKLFYNDQLVRLFPYASQCVVDSVIQAGLTPVTPLKFTSLGISYNQWGRMNLNLDNPPFIEDSVDSFYPLNSDVLRSGARFEVWSLSKIFGLRCGAILWCRSDSDAEEIRDFRNRNKSMINMSKRNILRMLRGISPNLYKRWEKFEFKHIPLFSYEYGEIFEKISSWQSLYNKRKQSYYSALTICGLDTTGDILELGGVIPVVIELPKNISTDDDNEIRSLHRIVNSDVKTPISVFPYQVKL
jgi:putative PLP-dependent aminotransferase (TIGR04422 family)